MKINCLSAITKQLQLWQKFCRICKKYSTKRFNCDPRRTNKDTKKLQAHSRKPVKKQLRDLKRVLKQIYCWWQSHREGNCENFRNFKFFFDPSFECVHTKKKCLLSGINQTEVWNVNTVNLQNEMNYFIRIQFLRSVNFGNCANPSSSAFFFKHMQFNYHFLTANSNTNLSFSRLTDERLKDGQLMHGADKSINFIFEEKKPHEMALFWRKVSTYWIEQQERI